MQTSIEIYTKDYDQVAVWPMTKPVFDTRPIELRGPDVGLHVHAYKNGRKIIHGTFDIVIIDGYSYFAAPRGQPIPMGEDA